MKGEESCQVNKEAHNIYLYLENYIQFTGHLVKNMEKIIGINPVIEVLKSDKNIEKIEIYKGIKKDTVKEILNLASRRNIKIFYTDRRTENSQGVVALVSEFDYYLELSEFLEKILVKDKSLIVILDQIQDPRNFGAIIRSAECFGVDGIVIQSK